MSALRVARLDALWDGEMRGFQVGGRKLLLVKLDGQVFAYEDRCAQDKPESNGPQHCPGGGGRGAYRLGIPGSMPPGRSR